LPRALSRLKELEQEKRRAERLASPTRLKDNDLLGRCRPLASAPAQPMGLVDLLDPLLSTPGLLTVERTTRGLLSGGVEREPVRPIIDNSSQFQQLFHHLCLNALEAMTAGGELTVRVVDLCKAGGSTLLVEFSVPDRRPSKLHT